MGMLVSSDVTILNKYCYVRRASVTLIPRVKASAGNTKIMGSSLGNRVNSHLCSSKTFGYCILQIAYSSAVMWSSVRKHAGFGWLQIKCKMWRACRRVAAVISVADCLWVIAKRGWTRWGRSVGSWTPLLLNLNKNSRVKEAFVFAGSRDPWEGNATVGSVSNMKEGEAPARKKNNHATVLPQLAHIFI